MTICLAGICTRAQSISKSVVSVNGGSYSGPGLMVDWTIGQGVQNSVTSSSYEVTEGFLPLNENAVAEATPITRNAVNALSVKAYPNPATNVLHLAIQQNMDQPLNMQMTDLLGRTVKTMNLGEELSTVADIDVSSLAAGMYYVVINTGRENEQVMKIVKN